MENGLIQKIVNRANRRMLIWSVAGLLAVAALLVFNLRYLYNFILGPFDTRPEQILQVGSAKAPQQYWVSVAGEELINTGITYYSTSDSGKETIEASYFVMPMDERLLLVRLKGNQMADHLPGQVTGWLVDVSGEENTEVITTLENDVPELEGKFLPYKLETGNFRLNGIIGIVVGLVILAASVWGLVTFARRSDDPATHPIMKALARFGTVETVIGQIEAELAVPHTTLGKLHLTNSWMVFEAPANLIATRYEDAVWVYMHVLNQKSYGITVSKTFTAKVYDRFGVVCDFIAGRKEQAVHEMLGAIAQHAPWAVMGYSDQLDAAWKKDRKGFIAAVEQRKAQYV